MGVYNCVASIKNGSVDEITLVSSGRGYTNTDHNCEWVCHSIFNNGAKILFSFKINLTIFSSITTITVDDNVPHAVGYTVPFFKQVDLGIQSFF